MKDLFEEICEIFENNRFAKDTFDEVVVKCEIDELIRQKMQEAWEKCESFEHLDRMGSEELEYKQLQQYKRQLFK